MTCLSNQTVNRSANNSAPMQCHHNPTEPVDGNVFHMYTRLLRYTSMIVMNSGHMYVWTLITAKVKARQSLQCCRGGEPGTLLLSYAAAVAGREWALNDLISGPGPP